MKNGLKERVASIFQEAINQLYQNGDLRRPYRLARGDLFCAKEPTYGDFSTTILNRLKPSLPPAEFHERLKATLMELAGKRDPGLVEKLEIILPCYLNFYLKKTVWDESLHRIADPQSNLVTDIGRGEKVLIEFVSANPTGPLTIAHGRQAAFGEALSRILTACGYRVTKEYYLNDKGRQIDLLGESLRCRCLQLQGQKVSLPEDGYQGEYLIPIARKLVAAKSDRLEEENLEFFSTYAVKEIQKEIESDLAAFGVSFDSYQRQSVLEEKGEVAEAIRLLTAKGVIYQKDGALFLKTSFAGDDKDRVLIKSDGSYTYLAPDLAYHRQKFLRGYDWLINLWGPDHFGYIERLKAGIASLGFEPERLLIIIIQLTTLYRGKEKVPMSTRTGEFLPLSQLVAELSADVTKFFFLSRKASSHLNFDLQLAKKESPENPIYYLQYAFARINSIFRYQKEKMPEISAEAIRTADTSRLTEADEVYLKHLVEDFGSTVGAAAENREPQILLAFLLELAKTFHRYYQRCQVVSTDISLTQSRLLLVAALQRVLKEGLRLLNIRAPERM